MGKNLLFLGKKFTQNGVIFKKNFLYSTSNVLRTFFGRFGVDCERKLFYPELPGHLLKIWDP